MSNLLTSFCVSNVVGSTNLGKMFIKLGQQNPSIWQDWMSVINWNEPCEKLSVYDDHFNHKLGVIQPCFPVEELIHHGSLDFIKTFLSKDVNPQIRIENASKQVSDDYWLEGSAQELWVAAAARRADPAIFDWVINQLEEVDNPWALFNWTKGSLSRSSNPLVILASKIHVSGDDILKMVKVLEKKWMKNYPLGKTAKITKEKLKDIHLSLLHNAAYNGHTSLVEAILAQKNPPTLDYDHWSNIVRSGKMEWAFNNYESLQKKYQWEKPKNDVLPWQHLVENMINQSVEAESGILRGFKIPDEWFKDQETSITEKIQYFSSCGNGRAPWYVNKSSFVSDVATALIRWKDAEKTWSSLNELQMPVSFAEGEWALKENHLTELTSRIENFGITPDFKKKAAEIIKNWACKRPALENSPAGELSEIEDFLRVLTEKKAVDFKVLHEEFSQYMYEDRHASWGKLFLQAQTPKPTLPSKGRRL